MAPMKFLASVLLATAVLAGCETNNSSQLEARVKKLEDSNKKYGEALDFLQKVYDQQKGQQAQQQREEPAPDAVFAVDIAQDIAGGQIEGPIGAPITIVEAWDFA
jgi:hypothetical protein